MDGYYTGTIKAGPAGTTRIVPSPAHVQAALAGGETPSRHVHHSGIIKAGAPGATRVVPSPSKEAAVSATPPRASQPYASGVIHARSQGYNVVTPLKDIQSGAAHGPAEPAATPPPPARHPIRASGDGGSTASPLYDGERGVPGAIPRRSGAISTRGDNGEPGSDGIGVPRKTGSGRIVATCQGYTKVVASSAQLAADAAAGGLASPARPRYVSSPIRSAGPGATNAGSILAVRSTPTSQGPIELARDPPKGHLPHGTIRYVADKRSPVARFVPPEQWAKDHPDSGQCAGALPPRAGKVIRATFPGYTNMSQ